MNNDTWHQKISIFLKAESPRKLSELKTILVSLGFKSTPDGEFYGFPRTDIVEEWQTGDIVDVAPYMNGEESCFDHECYEEWDSVELCYLLPWQPIENAEVFVKKAEEVSQALQIEAHFDSRSLNPERLLSFMYECANELEERMEAPGGDFLAKAIAMDLPI